MARSVQDVAAYIIERHGRMSSMKLQKLVYYSQAWHLVWDDEPLFPERIQAWPTALSSTNSSTTTEAPSPSTRGRGARRPTSDHLNARRSTLVASHSPHESDRGHLVALANGGHPFDRANARLAHRGCNASKGDRIALKPFRNPKVLGR